MIRPLATFFYWYQMYVNKALFHLNFDHYLYFFACAFRGKGVTFCSIRLEARSFWKYAPPASIFANTDNFSSNHSRNFPNKPQYLLNGQFSVIGCPYPLGSLPIMAGEASPENGCSFQLSGIIWKRVSMGLTISRANVLEIKRQPSKKAFFHCQLPKRKIDINRQKVSRYFKS